MGSGLGLGLGLRSPSMPTAKVRLGGSIQQKKGLVLEGIRTMSRTIPDSLVLFCMFARSQKSLKLVRLGTAAPCRLNHFRHHHGNQ